MDAQRRALQTAMQAQTDLASKKAEVRDGGFVAGLGHKWAVRKLQNKADVAMKTLKNAGFTTIKQGFDKLYGKTLDQHAANLGGVDDKPIDIADAELHLLLDLQENLDVFEAYDNQMIDTHSDEKIVLTPDRKVKLEAFAGKKVKGAEAPEGGIVDAARHKSHKEFREAQVAMKNLIDGALGEKDVNILGVLMKKTSWRDFLSTANVAQGRLWWEAAFGKGEENTNAFKRFKALIPFIKNESLTRMKEIRDHAEGGYANRAEFEKDFDFIRERLGNAVNKAFHVDQSKKFQADVADIDRKYRASKSEWAQADAGVRQNVQAQGKDDVYTEAHEKSVGAVGKRETLEEERRELIQNAAKAMVAQVDRVGGYRFVEKCLAPDGKSADQNWVTTTVFERMRHIIASLASSLGGGVIGLAEKAATKIRGKETTFERPEFGRTDTIKFRELMEKVRGVADGNVKYTTNLETLERNIGELQTMLSKAQREFEKAQEPDVVNLTSFNLLKANRLKEAVQKDNLAARTPEIVEVKAKDVKEGDCKWQGDSLLRRQEGIWVQEATYQSDGTIKTPDNRVYGLSTALAELHDNPDASGSGQVKIIRLTSQNPVAKILGNFTKIGEVLKTVVENVKAKRQEIESGLKAIAGKEHATNLFVAPAKPLILPEITSPGAPPPLAKTSGHFAYPVTELPLLGMRAAPLTKLPEPIRSSDLPHSVNVPDAIIPAPPAAGKPAPVVELTPIERESIDKLNSKQLRSLLLKINATMLSGTAQQPGVGDTTLPSGFFENNLNDPAASTQKRVEHHAPKLSAILAHIEARVASESIKPGIDKEKRDDWEDIQGLCEKARAKHPALKNANVTTTISGGETTVTTRTTTGAVSPKATAPALTEAQVGGLSAGVQGLSDEIKNAEQPELQGRLEAFISEGPSGAAYKELQNLNAKISDGKGAPHELERANYLVSYFKKGIDAIQTNAAEIQGAEAHNQEVGAQLKEVARQDADARKEISTALQAIYKELGEVINLAQEWMRSPDPKLKAAGEVLQDNIFAFNADQGKVVEKKLKELQATPPNEKLDKPHQQAAKDLSNFYKNAVNNLKDNAKKAGPIKAENDAAKAEFEANNNDIKRQKIEQNPKTQAALEKMENAFVIKATNQGSPAEIQKGARNHQARIHNLLFTGASGAAYTELKSIENKMKNKTATLDELNRGEQLATYFTKEIGTINTEEQKINELLTEYEEKTKPGPQDAA